ATATDTRDECCDLGIARRRLGDEDRELRWSVPDDALEAPCELVGRALDGDADDALAAGPPAWRCGHGRLPGRTARTGGVVCELAHRTRRSTRHSSVASID